MNYVKFLGRAGLALAVALGGCGKFARNDAAQSAREVAQAKRVKAICGSRTAYERLKAVIFDQAIRDRNGDRANLDMLADYSQARMERPVVIDRDKALDIIRCRGRFILDIPPGAEGGLAGRRQLQADILYTAQAAADGSGPVYRIEGAQPMVATLAAFNLPGSAYRPPPAIDEADRGSVLVQPPSVGDAKPPTSPSIATAQRAPTAKQAPLPPAPRPSLASPSSLQARPALSRNSAPVSTTSGTAEETVRAFYSALGRGDGGAASARIVPEKRSSRAYSAGAISRFYGRLPEPIRLTSIAPLTQGLYRVNYHYSAGRSQCNGSALVSVTNREGRDLIKSIRALSGC